MGVWLDGFEIIANRLGRGGGYEAGPWRFVAHTTEVVPSSLGGARSMAERHDAPPHLWAWPERRWKAQTVPLNRAGFALRHPKGTPPTNGRSAIQVEIIGRASETLHWPENWWDWLGAEVLAPVIEAGIPINLDRVAETTGPMGSGTDGLVRMTAEEWAGFDGVCCHANVPWNEHWDIGNGDLHRIADSARRALGRQHLVIEPEPEDPLMALAKNEDDLRRDHARALAYEYWGPGRLGAYDLDFLAQHIVEHGLELTRAYVFDHPWAVEFRKQRGW